MKKLSEEARHETVLKRVLEKYKDDMEAAESEDEKECIRRKRAVIKRMLKGMEKKD